MKIPMRKPGKRRETPVGRRSGSVQSRLNMLLLVCLVPLAILIIYLVILMQQFSGRYDEIVENITKANAFNIDFKEDLDYQMYIIVVNSERADELIDTDEPERLISEAREIFSNLSAEADQDYARQRLERIVRCLDSLDVQVKEIKEDASVSGNYDTNMERLDLDVRVLTELIQEQIQEYIYYETTNLETLRAGIRSDVDQAIRMIVLLFAAILVSAFLISRRIMQRITEPIQNLCRVTQQAADGDFTVRAENTPDGELAVLNDSFNVMIRRIGELVEDIRVEQLNLRATELRLLQAQINPHFLYNTLDTIIWLAEAGRKDEVVMMVTSLSSFFRTTLSKGRDYITVAEEETHIHSYLEIQQFRYRDILEYSIDIPEELHNYQILKLTLQPLVENALYHGIKNKRGLGHIRVTGEMQDQRLIFHVRDDGRGIRPEELARIRREIRETDKGSRTGSSGFGLFNVSLRLQLNYGKEYGLSIDSVYGEWTEVTVVIPAQM